MADDLIRTTVANAASRSNHTKAAAKGQFGGEADQETIEHQKSRAPDRNDRRAARGYKQGQAGSDKSDDPGIETRRSLPGAPDQHQRHGEGLGDHDYHVVGLTPYARYEVMQEPEVQGE